MAIHPAHTNLLRPAAGSDDLNRKLLSTIMHFLNHSLDVNVPGRICGDGLKPYAHSAAGAHIRSGRTGIVDDVVATSAKHIFVLLLAALRVVE